MEAKQNEIIANVLREAINKRWEKIISLEKDIKNHRYHTRQMHEKLHELTDWEKLNELLAAGDPGERDYD
jgi:hypothetical protein